MTSSFAPIVFEPLLKLFGLFPTKLAMCSMTTIGVFLLAFYKVNSFFITGKVLDKTGDNLFSAAWQLMGFPSVMYMVIAITELTIRFPSKISLTLCLVCGLHDASAGVFVIAKVTY